MRSIFYFESMITPRIITALYWLLLVASIVGGFAVAFGLGPMTLPGIATGIVVIAAGALAARVGCELLIVLFKINESMETVSHRL